MSLRNVELQIAIPRTQELGKIQDQIQHHPQQEQAGIAMSHLEEWERDQSRPLASSESEANHLKEHGRKNHKKRPGPANLGGKHAALEEIHKAQKNLHPYMGHNFDNIF